jgi:acetylornithine deacetylase/succinyl-diaminopimelate desuccinylase-like protein
VPPTSLPGHRDGISHSPLEYVSPDDVAAATATLYRYLRKELLFAGH